MKNKTTDLYEFVRLPFFMYKVVAGIHLFNWNDNESSNIIGKCANFIFISNISFNLFTMFLYIFFGDLSDAKDLTLFVALAAFVVNTFTKTGSVWKGRKIIEEVFIHIRSTYPETKENQKQHRVADYFQKYILHAKALFSLSAITGVLMSIIPIMQSILEYYSSPEEERVYIYRFPYILYYPFNENHFLIFPFMYILQCLAGACMVALFISTDLVLIATANLINMQYEHLSFEIGELRPIGTDDDIKRFADLIRKHNSILSNSDKINQIFSLSILLNYIATGFCICLMAFQIVAGYEILVLLKFVFFLMAATSHLYSICSVSSDMIIVSTNVCDAFFHHPWYMANIKYKKMLVLPIARSQKPAYLTAFKFFIVSMESFKSLLSIAYQVFTLLSSTLEE